MTLSLEWLNAAELLTFIGLIITLIYNRVMTYRNMTKDVVELKIAFAQYQKDMAHYLEICELCRGEVRRHHEDEVDKHVTSSMREQISTLVGDVAEIKRYLMEHPR